MKKKISEAQVRIDITDLESSDFASLARMMELAGQAEQASTPGLGGDAMGGMGTPGSIGGALDSIMPGSEPEVGGMEEPGLDAGAEVGSPDMGTPDIGSEMEVGAEPSADPLQGAIDSLGGATDFGADMEEPQNEGMFESDESEEEDEDELIAEELHRMAMLSGLVLEDVEEVDSTDDVEDSDDTNIEEARIIPDLSLEEADGNDEHGPFKSEDEAIRDAKWKTNGELGDTFTVEPKEDGYFYWCRVMQEQAFSTEADPEFADTDGIQYSRHRMKPKFNGAALGDNPLREEDEEEDDESVDDIFESLQKKYNAFLGGK